MHDVDSISISASTLPSVLGAGVIKKYKELYTALKKEEDSNAVTQTKRRDQFGLAVDWFGRQLPGHFHRWVLARGLWN
jgi:hypothetical protein